MITETTTEPTTTTEDATASAPKLAKTATATLTANGATMNIVAERKGDGAKTYVLTTDAGKKTVRGMSETHASFELAKAATEKMAKTAEKLGWQRKAARRGFVTKPDAFSTLPPAPKAAKK